MEQNVNEIRTEGKTAVLRFDRLAGDFFRKRQINSARQGEETRNEVKSTGSNQWGQN